MSSDNHASYSRIGVAVVLGVVAIIATLIYIGGLGSNEDMVYAETYYDRSVSGLSVGSAVNFRGVHIGKVAEISFVGNKYSASEQDCQRIYILMAIRRQEMLSYDDETITEDNIFNGLIKRGLRATVTASGITGLSRIEFDIFTNNPPVAAISWQPRHPYVPAKVSLIEDFSDAATKVMNQINKMDLTATWSNLNATVKHLSETSGTAQRLMEARRDEIEQIFDNVSETTTSLRSMSQSLRRNPSLIIRESYHEPLAETN